MAFKFSSLFSFSDYQLILTIKTLKGCNNGKIKLLPRLKVVTMAKKIITTLKGCNNLLLQRLNVVTLFGLKLLQPFSNCYNI